MDLHEKHLRWLWAAYKLGKLEILPEGLTKEEFAPSLNSYMLENSLIGYAFVKGDDVIGIGLFWPRGRVYQVSDLIWFPWTSPWTVVKAFARFVHEVRETDFADGQKYMILEFAREQDQGFFDHMCKYGIMRRIGTSHEIYPDGKACVYESRRKD